ncbi:MAG TPA: NAD(P)-binding protein [Tepidisphaeraceae bacterium]|nr:NAD(P)-binding protein [Tepidisphaeraceae bacterium]
MTVASVHSERLVCAVDHDFPRRASRPKLASLYFLALLHEFRWTLLCLLLAIVLGAALYAITPQEQLSGRRPSLSTSLYGGWMALLAQPIYAPPEAWYLKLVTGLYPIIGVLLIGEGIVRFALLMISRKHGEKEWMRVMASTYRDHVVLCGLGHLGARVLKELHSAKIPVVVIEKDQEGRFLTLARELAVPVLLRDMTEDQALIDAGVAEARVIIIATNSDMQNLEVALDSRRMNPKIRVIMRLYDQQIASKISSAMMIDAAFSSSALAAPMVAAMAMNANVLGSSMIAGVPHLTCELKLPGDTRLAGQRIDKIEADENVRILARTPSAGKTDHLPQGADLVQGGDTLVVHLPSDRLSSLSASIGSK